MKAKDKITKKQRSVLMSKIRSEKTAFEMDFFKKLRKSGMRFETHPRDIFGHPDLVVRNGKICVFLDSDFWHGWQYPRWKYSLDRRWRTKIERNRKRDKKVIRFLRKRGWIVVRVWEHSLVKGINKFLFSIRRSSFCRKHKNRDE